MNTKRAIEIHATYVEKTTVWFVASWANHLATVITPRLCIQ